MLPTTFEGFNKVYEKPEGWTDEQCINLPIYRGKTKIEGGIEIPIIISCWKFSKEDLEEIAKTNCIFLSVMSNVLPPVQLSTENPFI